LRANASPSICVSLCHTRDLKGDHYPRVATVISILTLDAASNTAAQNRMVSAVTVSPENRRRD